MGNDQSRSNKKDLDGPQSFSVWNNERVKHQLKSFKQLKRDVLRANAVSAMIREELGMQLGFVVTSTVTSDVLLDAVWKLKGKVVIRVEQLFEDEDGDVYLCSVKAFYFLLLAMEDVFSGVQATASNKDRQLRPPTQGLVDDGVADDDECPICLDHNVDIVLPCTHTMCRTCYNEWMKEQQNCPLCRTRQTTDDDLWVLTDEQTFQEQPEMINACVQASKTRVQQFLLGLPHPSQASSRHLVVHKVSGKAEAALLHGNHGPPITQVEPPPTITQVEPPPPTSTQFEHGQATSTQDEPPTATPVQLPDTSPIEPPQISQPLALPVQLPNTTQVDNCPSCGQQLAINRVSNHGSAICARCGHVIQHSLQADVPTSTAEEEEHLRLAMEQSQMIR